MDREKNVVLGCVEKSQDSIVIQNTVLYAPGLYSYAIHMTERQELS